MAAHKGTVEAVMLGVGAAFDFLAGRKRQAPKLLQRLGLEWLFRLLNEPRRLWRRYLYRVRAQSPSGEGSVPCHPRIPSVCSGASEDPRSPYTSPWRED